MTMILSVSDLTRAVKDLLEAEFPFVWVRGQVTNLARPGSGHIYFSLTDGDAVLSAVWFKGAQGLSLPSEGGEKINPLTGEVEEDDAMPLARTLEDGMEVLCAGRLNVYEPRGQYQLVAELVQEQGVGDLRLAFEAMKRKLEAKGYFDADRKMDIPDAPGKVAVITSPSGAAIRDFLRIADERGTGAEIRIYPALVQGDRAPEQIAAALDAVSDDGWADVAVLIRGGGSLEDLWAFNTEPVADALFRSTVPVVCGVGHEPDVSIADYVADLRVATPSHAAQVLWPRRETLMQAVDQLELELRKTFLEFLDDKEDRFDRLRQQLVWFSPMRRLERLEDRFRSQLLRLEALGRSHLDSRVGRASSLMARLERAFGPGEVDRTRHRLGTLLQRMQSAAEHRIEGASGTLRLAEAGLRGLNPEGPLERGYSLVTIGRTGTFLRDPHEVNAGDALQIRIRGGSVAATVAETHGTKPVPETGEQ